MAKATRTTATAPATLTVAEAKQHPMLQLGTTITVAPRNTTNGTAYGVTFTAPRISGTALIKVLAMKGYSKLTIKAIFGVLGLPLANNTLNAQYASGSGSVPGDDTAHSKVPNPATWPAEFIAGIAHMRQAIEAEGQPAVQAYADLTKTNAASLPAMTVAVAEGW